MHGMRSMEKRPLITIIGIMDTVQVTRRYTSSNFSSAIFNRIAMDVSMNSIEHVVITESTDDRKTIFDGLHNCLNTEANIDQTGMQFLQDIVYSMFDEGVVAVVPVDTSLSPESSGSYEINSMRTGRITQWFPKHVRVNLYNEATGNHEEVTLPKSAVAIIENPLYAVINGPNATLSRLLLKMAQVDDIDALVASGQLDLIFQVPYTVKSELQKAQAQERYNSLEQQLTKNKRGIAYIDGSENITQLNRPISPKIVEDIQALTQQFYNQLGLTENIFNGTASESEMRGYYMRTIDPIINNIILEFERKFLTKTARTQGHALESYRDPFSLVPISDLAKIADAFRRNSVLTSNEMRGVMGFRRSSEPEADQLYNPNLKAEDQINAPKAIGSVASPDSDTPDQNE